MSKRQLPELRRPDAPEGVEFAVHPQARAAFDPDVRAAAKDEATISILAEIGENWGRYRRDAEPHLGGVAFDRVEARHGPDQQPQAAASSTGWRYTTCSRHTRRK
jgi:hypothetical protein